MRYYQTLLLALILAFSGATADDSRGKSTQSESNDIANFLLGELAIMRDDFPTAATYFDSLLERHHDNFLLERRIGIDIAADQLDRALPNLKRLVAKDPTSLSSWNTLALSYLEAGEMLQAIDAFNRMLQVGKAQGINGYPIIIQALQDDDQNQQLIEVLEGIVTLNPEDARGMLVTAGVMIDMKHDERAEVLLQEAKKIMPDNALIYQFLSMLALKSGDMERSLTILADAYATYPTEVFGVQYAKGLKQNLQYDEALALLKKLEQRGEQSSYQLIKELALIQYALGDYRAVKGYLNQLLNNGYFYIQTATELFELSQKSGTQAILVEIMPQVDAYEFQYEWMIHQANLALLDNNYGQFAGLFDELRYNYPQLQEQLYVRQIVMLEELQRYEEMGGLIEFSAPIIEVDYLITYMRGMHQFHLGNYGAMEQIFDDWLTIYPEDDIILNAYGYSILEYDESRADEALAMILKANELTPGEDFIEDSLGWAYLKLGQLDKAERYLTKAFNRTKEPEMIAHYLILQHHLDRIDEVYWVYEIFKRLYPKNQHLKALQKEYEWAK